MKSTLDGVRSRLDAHGENAELEDIPAESVQNETHPEQRNSQVQRPGEVWGRPSRRAKPHAAGGPEETGAGEQRRPRK